MHVRSKFFSLDLAHSFRTTCTAGIKNCHVLVFYALLLSGMGGQQRKRSRFYFVFGSKGAEKLAFYRINGTTKKFSEILGRPVNENAIKIDFIGVSLNSMISQNWSSKPTIGPTSF